jgi:hypothetical protein
LGARRSRLAGGAQFGALEATLRSTGQTPRRTQSDYGDCPQTAGAIWYVLTREETDRYASEEDLAYKMLVLSWDLDEEARLGLTYKQYAKYALMKLGIETDITRFVRKNVPRRVAPRDEVLAQMKELGLSL